MKNVLFFSLCILLFSAGCGRSSQNVAATENLFAPHHIGLSTDPDEELKVEDVKFSYDRKVFSEVKGSVLAAEPLENKDDKPDHAQPGRVQFRLVYKKAKTERTAQISVYQKDEYPQAFAIAPYLVETLEKSFADLRKAMDGSDKIAPSASEQLPLIPFYDADQDFYAKAKTVRFQNGKGLLFLTQMTQDVTIISNYYLEYVFQGLTDDGRFFILAEFPVSAKGLPEEWDADSFEDYRLPENFYGAELEKNRRENLEYRKKMAVRLENTPAGNFTPDLKKIEDLLASIKIR
ncbi:MAG: hypothetical protein R2747_20965 [Pyrinomonadaceae bacterium]